MIWDTSLKLCSMILSLAFLSPSAIKINSSFSSFFDKGGGKLCPSSIPSIREMKRKSRLPIFIFFCLSIKNSANVIFRWLIKYMHIMFVHLTLFFVIYVLGRQNDISLTRLKRQHFSSDGLLKLFIHQRYMRSYA